jgi:hypothetical protein
MHLLISEIPAADTTLERGIPWMDAPGSTLVMVALDEERVGRQAAVTRAGKRTWRELNLAVMRLLFADAF